MSGDAGRRSHASAPEGSAPLRWRTAFGEVWGELAAPGGDRRDALCWAAEAIDSSRQRLDTLSMRGSDADFHRSLACAASVLEGCARVSAGYAVPSQRLGRVELLRALEGQLQRIERSVLRADDRYLGLEREVATDTEEAIRALEELSHCDPGPVGNRSSGAVSVLRQSSVAVAALLIWAALELRSGGLGEDPPRDVIDGIERQWAALRVADRQQRKLRSQTGAQNLIRRCLVDAVAVELPPAARAPGVDSDPVRRARTLRQLASAWLRIGGSQYVIVEELDRQATVPVFGRPAVLRDALVQQSAQLVHKGRLGARAARFDHTGAWRRAHKDLGALAPGPRRSAIHPPRATVVIVFGGLLRTLAALWVVQLQLDQIEDTQPTGG